MQPDEIEDGEDWTCPSCGHVAPDGEQEQPVEDERLWGAVGEVLDVCPACGHVDL
jgi:rubrerythrin